MNGITKNSAAAAILGNRIDKLVALKGPGWVVQTGVGEDNRGTLQIHELLEQGTTMFLADAWSHELFATEADAVKKYPQLKLDGLHEIHRMGAAQVLHSQHYANGHLL